MNVNQLHFLFICTLLVSINFVCTVRSIRVLVGSVEEKDQFPFLVQFTDAFKTLLTCCGSLIHPEWVLTAADCFPKSKSEIKRIERLYLDNVYTVCMRSKKFNDSGAYLNYIEKICIHPGFQKTNVRNILDIRNNIALVKLIEPYVLNRYVSTISLPLQRSRHEICRVGLIISVEPTPSNWCTGGGYINYADMIVKDRIRDINQTSNTIFYAVKKLKSTHAVQSNNFLKCGSPFICISDITIPNEIIQYGVVAGSIELEEVVTYVEDVEKHMEFIYKSLAYQWSYTNPMVTDTKTTTNISKNFVKRSLRYRKKQKIYEDRVEGADTANSGSYLLAITLLAVLYIC